MTQSKTSLLTTTGLFAALITLTTAYICHIPYGANGGYIHFGDSLIYLAAILLPRPYAIGAAMLGGGLADLLTAPMWAPFTLIAKALLVISFTSTSTSSLCMRNKIAPFIGMCITILVYYIAEGILYGSFVTPVFSIFGNVIQGTGSAIFFYLSAYSIEKSKIKSRFF